MSRTLILFLAVIAVIGFMWINGSLQSSRAPADAERSDADIATPGLASSSSNGVAPKPTARAIPDMIRFTEIHSEAGGPEHGLTLIGDLRNNVYSDVDAICNDATFLLVGQGKSFNPSETDCSVDRIAPNTSGHFTVSFFVDVPGHYQLRYDRVNYDPNIPQYEYHSVTVQ